MTDASRAWWCTWLWMIATLMIVLHANLVPTERIVEVATCNQRFTKT